MHRPVPLPDSLGGRLVVVLSLAGLDSLGGLSGAMSGDSCPTSRGYPDPAEVEE